MTSKLVPLVADVFCDYLSVTCHPEASFYDDLYVWCVAEWPVRFDVDGVVGFDVGSHGLVSLAKDRNHKFHRSSASGDALRRMREIGAFGDYLSLLSAVPHKVTRLDAALDVPVDFPVIYGALMARYPDDRVALTRKQMVVTHDVSARLSDGVRTGTWYVGKKSKARVTAAVYDKQEEAFAKRGEILPPTTRYEMRFSKDLGCTLRDAYMPKSLFYEFASPAILDRPDQVPSWTPHGESWQGEPVEPKLTYTQLLNRIDNSPELLALQRMAVDLGEPGIELLLNRIGRSLRGQLSKSEAA